MKYDYKVVVRPNGNLDVYDEKDNLRWQDISPIGFGQVLTVSKSCELKPGDKIHAKGVTATIAKIEWQEYYEDSGYSCEFVDTRGIYRSWKQAIDGGTVETA